MKNITSIICLCLSMIFISDARAASESKGKHAAIEDARVRATQKSRTEQIADDLAKLKAAAESFDFAAAKEKNLFLPATLFYGETPEGHDVGLYRALRIGREFKDDDLAEASYDLLEPSRVAMVSDIVDTGSTGSAAAGVQTTHAGRIQQSGPSEGKDAVTDSIEDLLGKSIIVYSKSQGNPNLRFSYAVYMPARGIAPKGVIVSYYGGDTKTRSADALRAGHPSLGDSAPEFLKAGYIVISLLTEDSFVDINQKDQFKTPEGKQLLANTMISLFLFLKDIRQDEEFKGLPVYYYGESFGGTKGALASIMLSNYDHIPDLFKDPEFQRILPGTFLSDIGLGDPKKLLDGVILHDGAYHNLYDDTGPSMSDVDFYKGQYQTHQMLYQLKAILDQTMPPIETFEEYYRKTKEGSPPLTTFKTSIPILILQNYDDERVTIDNALHLYDKIIASTTDRKIVWFHLTPQTTQSNFQKPETSLTSVDAHGVSKIFKYKQEYWDKIFQFIDANSGKQTDVGSQLSADRVMHAKRLALGSDGVFDSTTYSGSENHTKSKLYRIYNAHLHQNTRLPESDSTGNNTTLRRVLLTFANRVDMESKSTGIDGDLRGKLVEKIDQFGSDILNYVYDRRVSLFRAGADAVKNTKIADAAVKKGNIKEESDFNLSYLNQDQMRIFNQLMAKLSPEQKTNLAILININVLAENMPTYIGWFNYFTRYLSDALYFDVMKKLSALSPDDIQGLKIKYDELLKMGFTPDFTMNLITQLNDGDCQIFKQHFNVIKKIISKAAYNPFIKFLESKSAGEINAYLIAIIKLIDGLSEQDKRQLIESLFSDSATINLSLLNAVSALSGESEYMTKFYLLKELKAYAPDQLNARFVIAINILSDGTSNSLIQALEAFKKYKQEVGYDEALNIMESLGNFLSPFNSDQKSRLIYSFENVQTGDLKQLITIISGLGEGMTVDELSMLKSWIQDQLKMPLDKFDDGFIQYFKKRTVGLGQLQKIAYVSQFMNEYERSKRSTLSSWVSSWWAGGAAPSQAAGVAAPSAGTAAAGSSSSWWPGSLALPTWSPRSTAAGTATATPHPTPPQETALPADVYTGVAPGGVSDRHPSA